MLELVLEERELLGVLKLLVGQRLEGLGRTLPVLLKGRQVFERLEELGCQRPPGA